jgi:hypothetical protein
MYDHDVRLYSDFRPVKLETKSDSQRQEKMVCVDAGVGKRNSERACHVCTTRMPEVRVNGQSSWVTAATDKK